MRAGRRGHPAPPLPKSNIRKSRSPPLALRPAPQAIAKDRTRCCIRDPRQGMRERSRPSPGRARPRAGEKAPFEAADFVWSRSRPHHLTIGRILAARECRIRHGWRISPGRNQDPCGVTGLYQHRGRTPTVKPCSVEQVPAVASVSLSGSAEPTWQKAPAE